jgi:branched-chain amino acid aminotransferase
MKSAGFKTVVLINGRQVPRAQAKVSVFDNALLYAEGLFETFLAVEDRVIFLDEHLDRLYKGAGVIDVQLPVDRQTLSRWMKRTVKLHPAGIKKLRLTVTSGESARWVGVQGRPQVILAAAPHEMPASPFRLLASDLRVDQTSVFRRIKTISYAIHASALKRARQQGFDDALLLNGAGEVAEITSANIFWVKNGRVFTPPLSAGCLEGVTRRMILQNADEYGLTITETSDQLSGVLAADEAFISSSLKLVVGVSEIMHDGIRYSLPAGPVTKLLASRFSDMVFGSQA